MNSRKTPIKIVIATPNSGGPATYAKLLFEKLPLFGYEVGVVDFGDVLKYPKLIRHIIYFFKLLRKARKADIVYAQDPVSVGLPAILAAKIAGKRFFLKVVGDYAWEQGTQRFGVKDSLNNFVVKSDYPFMVKILRYVERLVARKAEKIIVPSNYLKGIVEKWGITENKIEVIHNAFVKPEIPESKEDLRKKLNWDFPVIISVGRLVPWKNFDVLIDAASVVLKNIPDAKFFIIGDGPERGILEKKIVGEKLSESVSLLGHMPQKDLYKYIKAADIFALISSYEGFSHLLIEAMSLGAPIVTTAVGGNVEVIKDKKNGIFVPKGYIKEISKAIVEILHNKSLADSLSKEAKSSVEVFSEDKMLQKLTLILR